MNWAFGRSVSRTHVFLFQWTADGDNGADGHHAQRPVEEAARPRQGGLKKERKMVDANVYDAGDRDVGVATPPFVQQQQ